MSTVPVLETIEITKFDNGVTEIALNRPTRYNALSAQSYRDWLVAIRWAAADDEVKVVVFTGRGKFFSSGQELTMRDLGEDVEAEMARRRQTTKSVVTEMINFPKLLIAAVNGPAIGFGATTLALCDIVYSVPHATFNTPFMKLGFCAEACSSILFPKIMGQSKANEMLLLGKTFTAQEMADCGFISKIIPADVFRETALASANLAAEYSLEAMKATKKLIRDVDRETLYKVNEEEMRVLDVRMTSNDSIESVMKFMSQAAEKKAKKAKL
ncbi:ClpP/crotonase-like domain-containing protein [Pilobolus umbonatus]|nr:ClpP/crotonase-like domain-containing protein [Pilobolus umbonatus]